MNKLVNEIIILGVMVSLLACNSKKNEEVTKDLTATNYQIEESIDISTKTMPPVQWVLTAEEQAALSPDEVTRILKEGNERFLTNDLTARDHSAQVRKSTYAQFPKAIVLSCVDSRIPVEDVFDRGIGDINVARVAGNFVNDDILGSMEFACKFSGAKLIIVLGHENCEILHATIDDVKIGNVTGMLKNIEPAVLSTQYEGERNSINPEFVHKVCENNVTYNIQQIKAKSPILKEMAEKGNIKILGAIYDMDSGAVTFL